MSLPLNNQQEMEQKNTLPTGWDTPPQEQYLEYKHTHKRVLSINKTHSNQYDEQLKSGKGDRGTNYENKKVVYIITNTLYKYMFMICNHYIFFFCQIN